MKKKYMENEDSCNVCPKDGGSSAGGTHIPSSLSLLFLSPQLPVLSTPGDHRYSLSLCSLHTRSLYPSASALVTQKSVLDKRISEIQPELMNIQISKHEQSY